MSIREYKSEPCPICGHTGWCGRRNDGLILCKRPPSPPEVAGYIHKGLAGDGQTGMYVEAGKERGQASGPPPSVRRGPANRPAVSFETLAAAHEAAAAALTPELRCALASELGLPGVAPSEVAIGWSDTAEHHADHRIAGAYIFPEYDGQGRLVGVSYRFPAEKVTGLTDDDGKPIGSKSSPAGLRRGLTLPLCWREMPDPVLIVEGPSDVLAARTVGLSAVGRPSNSGGVHFIAQLCRRRQVILLGENDRKPDGRWPGKEGAEAVARRLESRWQRPVPIAYPPEGIKDLRDWVGELAAVWDAADLPAVRQTILNAVQPPELLLLAQERDRRGRVTVKVFCWNDGADGAAIHSDRLYVEDAAARRRFARAVAKVVPETDVEDLARQLLAMPLPADARQRAKALLDERAGDEPQRNPAATQLQDVTPAQADGRQMPVVFVPGGPATILRSAVQLGGLLAGTGKYYIRGGMVTTVGKDRDGRPILEVIKPAGLASIFETVARIMGYIKQKGEFVAEQAIFTEQAAKLIQHSAAFQALLPPIHLLSRCPVLVERGRELIQISGYDRESGILAFGEPAPQVELDEAVGLLSEMLTDFRFATSADRARALSAIITPAMVFGGLLGGRAPIDLGEADLSQSGKGYRARLTAAVYNHVVKTVTQRKGGVGSLEESFCTALVAGHNFISFDNIRSAIDSPSLESFLTEDSFLARVPHLAAIEVDPRRVIVQLTSNRAEITPDLANRSSCVRILKQPEDYHFRQFPEGDILDHVRANQPLYLGAVFTVVKAWHAAGKPRTDTTGHDFRAWAKSLDWIVQNIFQAGALLDGHRETQARMATPVLNWLRDVALAVHDGGYLGTWLRANNLVDTVALRPDTELPGLPEGGDLVDDDVRKKVLQAVGRRMAQCFGADSVLEIDTFRIERKETEDLLNRRTTREYCFQTTGEAVEKCAYAPDAPVVHRRTIGAESPEQGSGTAQAAGSSSPSPAESGVCAYAAPMGAPIGAPIKPPCAPIAPMGSQIAQRDNQNTHVLGKACVIGAANRGVIGTHRRIGATGAEPPPPADPTAEPDEVLV